MKENKDNSCEEKDLEISEKTKSNTTKNEIIEWIKTIAVALVVACIINIFIAPTIVKGNSMYPTLQNNNYLILNKTAYWNKTPNRGDIVVFKSELLDDKGEKKDLVKRIIGIPGDDVRVRDGKVYLNGDLIEEPYINENYTDGFVDITVPDGKVFVMGDNRLNSFDSRESQVGNVDIKNDIIGKVFIRLFPFNKIEKF